MRFDQLPTELVMKIAEITDLPTRSYASRTSQRMHAIFSKFPHFQVAETIEFVNVKQNGIDCILAKIQNGPTTALIKLTYSRLEAFSDLFVIGETNKIVFRDMHCSSDIVGTVLRFVPALRNCSQLTFCNCVFAFTGKSVAKIAEKYSIKSVEVASPSVVNGNILGLLNDEFFETFNGDFHLNTRINTDIVESHVITDRTMVSLKNTHRKIFKIETICSHFTPSIIIETITEVLSNNLEVDWNLGVFFMSPEELSLFDDTIDPILNEAAMNKLASYSSFWHDIQQIPFKHYSFHSEQCQIRFKVRHLVNVLR